MNLAELVQWADIAGAVIGFLLTVAVLSYIFGDNVLFRSAIHIFIGVAAGYVAVLVVYNVILSQLVLPLIRDPGSRLVWLIPPLLLGGWLLTKASPRLARLGNPVLGYLVGVGAATAIGGAVLGTILPQTLATVNLFDLEAAQDGLIWTLVKAVIMALVTVVTLAYFHFGDRRTNEPITRPRFSMLNQVGQGFIAITFGVIFAGVLTTALTALVERIYALWNFIVVYIFPLLPLK